MADISDYMTVRQVMDEIGARARSTVTRLLRDEAARPRGVGFPRGETRAEEPEPPKKAKKAKKAC